MGYKKGDFFCDLAYTLLLIDDRDVAARTAEGVLPGEYTDGDAHMIAASVGYKL